MGTSLPEIGKISSEIFDEIILPQLGRKRSEVLIGPQHGVDVGVTDINTFTDGEELNANVSYPVEVEVCNFGNDEANIPVHVVIDGTGTNYTPPPPPPTCTYEIVLWDDFGDGWNGNSLDVLVNSVVVLDDITLASGSGPESHFFTVTEGDTIDIVYDDSGSWDYENNIDLIDGTSN